MKVHTIWVLWDTRRDGPAIPVAQGFEVEFNDTPDWAWGRDGTFFWKKFTVTEEESP